jgi:hypothetical protein
LVLINFLKIIKRVGFANEFATLPGLPPLRSGDPRKGKLSQRKLPVLRTSTFFVFSLLRMNSQRFKTKNAVPYRRHFSLAESGVNEPNSRNPYIH